jgi:RNA polymerase sigma-70 factor (ECF subfamily)
MSSLEVSANELLLLQIATGDELAFRQLFLEFAPQINIRLSRLLANRSVAEDIIQETFLRVWLHRDQLPEIKQWRSWILRIAYNRAFTYLRDQAIHERALAKLKVREEEDHTQQAVELRNLKKIIAEAVAQLPPQQKRIYQLNREQGLMISEISDRLDLSPQTIKNTLGLALKSIRHFLETKGHYVVSIALAYLF